MTFAEKVKTERHKLKLNQSELAKKVGVTTKIISNYETGKSRPRGMKNYERLAVALEVNVNYLLTENELFVASSEQNYGYRGKAGAQKLVNELTGLFAGGEMEEDDMDVLMLAVQEAYVLAKKNNKKYTPKKYLNDKE
ncbi:MAG: helix-turn-helix transcriptional regulator [Clostridia bacterium]